MPTRVQGPPNMLTNSLQLFLDGACEVCRAPEQGDGESVCRSIMIISLEGLPVPSVAYMVYLPDVWLQLG